MDSEVHRIADKRSEYNPVNTADAESRDYERYKCQYNFVQK